MNERIRELIKQMDQAGLPYGDNAMTVTDKDLEYFAELIVRECLEVLRLVPYDTDREFGDEVIYQDAVKKHFGVEVERGERVVIPVSMEHAEFMIKVAQDYIDQHHQQMVDTLTTGK
jgi:hypothetical protein